MASFVVLSIRFVSTRQLSYHIASHFSLFWKIIYDGCSFRKQAKLFFIFGRYISCLVFFKFNSDSVKVLGPILLRDNARIHDISHVNIDVHPLPRYSPFLNLAEFINREHKGATRILFRKERLSGELRRLENVPKGCM